MTFSNINVSNPNDGLGTKLRDAFIIVNDNFELVGDMVTPEQLSATLSNYTTIVYVDNIEGGLQDQIDFINGRLNTDDSDIETLQDDLNALQILVDGKASVTQLNNMIATINNTITTLQLNVDVKIGDAPNDGFTYGRKNNTWIKL